MQQCLHTNNMLLMFEQQISILEGFLKDYVVVMLKIQLCIKIKLRFKIYSNENCYFKITVF